MTIHPTNAPFGSPPFIHLKVHSAYSLLEGALQFAPDRPRTVAVLARARF